MLSDIREQYRTVIADRISVGGAKANGICRAEYQKVGSKIEKKLQKST